MSKDDSDAELLEVSLFCIVVVGSFAVPDGDTVTMPAGLRSAPLAPELRSPERIIPRPLRKLRLINQSKKPATPLASFNAL